MRTIFTMTLLGLLFPTLPVGAANAPVNLLHTWNVSTVKNGPTAPATFTVSQECQITYINTYHWNNGKGCSQPGKISLQHEDGTKYGPWSTTGSPGQGGVPNALWECHPKVTIKKGKYTVVDSDPATWSQNVGSGGRGMTTVQTSQAVEEKGTSGMDVDTAIKTIDAIAEGATGRCASHVRQALKAGGLKTDEAPTEARQYGSYLISKGFIEVSKDGYEPKKGDVVVIQARPGGAKYGHIAMYNGQQWVSDFKQRSFYGSTRTADQPNKEAYKFYRP